MLSPVRHFEISGTVASPVGSATCARPPPCVVSAIAAHPQATVIRRIAEALLRRR
jgi:hypothetical protein